MGLVSLATSGYGSTSTCGLCAKRGLMSEGRAGNPDAGPAGITPASAGLVLRLARILVAGLPRHEIAREILEACLPLLGGSAAWLLLRRDGELRLEAAIGLPASMELRLGHVPLDAPALEAAALREGRIRFAPAGEAPSDLDWTTSVLADAGLPGLVAVPIVEGALGAVLAIGRPAPLDTEEAHLASVLGEIFARTLVAGHHHLDAQPAGSVADELDRIRAEIARCRKVEDELRESEERFRLAMEEAPMGMAIVALTGRFVRVNKALCGLLGYTAEEMRALRFQDITHPADLENDLALVDALVAGRIPRYEMEKRYIRKDGSEVLILLGVSLLRDERGAPWYFVSRVEDITERRRIEEQLRQREQMFRGLFDTALDPIVIFDDEGRFADVNAACAALVGIDRERLIGRPTGVLGRRLNGFDVSASLHRLREEGSLTGEIRVTTAAGGVRVLEYAARAHFVPGKHLAILRDITERVRAADELRTREAQLAEAQAIAHVGHFEIDYGTDTVYASAEAFRIYGYPAEQGHVPRSTLIAAQHPDDRAWVQAAIADAVRRLGAFSFDHRIVRTDGETRLLHSQGVAARNDAGVRTLGIVQDITEQRRAAEERERLLATLAAERTWLETLVDWLPVAVVLLDADGNVRANRRAHDLLGPLGDDATPASIGARLCDASGASIPPGQMPLLRAVQGHSVQAREIGVCRPDGGRTPALVSASPIRDEGGDYLGAVAVFEDVTALKELERMREEWTSVVAHDLRQPVTVINAQAQLLARKVAGGDPEVRAKVEHIRASARQLGRMIGDLLDVSRIEARRLALDRQETALEPFVRMVLERHSDEIRGHEVAVRAPPDLPEVSIDPVRVEQVLGNLLSNAVKYGSPGGPITVDLEHEGSAVACAVTNEGRGIDPEDIPNLFERFFRAKNARDGKIAGMGLGLYITRGLVEAHGGTIEATSEPGRTTTFRFTLPLS